MKNILRIVSTVTLLACLTSCGSKPLAKHVILIGFDGMSSADFVVDEMPATKALMDQGCWTFKKRSVLPSASAINWASMFMGVGTELHGYTTWGSKTPELQSRVVNAHGISPTIFSILKEQRPDSETGCIYHWKTIKCLIDSLAVDYTEQGMDKDSCKDSLCILAENYIKEKKPTLFAICWDHPDHEGHSCGWGSAEYHEAMKELDRQAARVIQATKDAGIYDDTIFIVTSDHGGKDRKHGKISLNEMETPFIIAGKNIRKGGEIQESMMQFDVAATIAEIFKLERPQVWIGRPVMSVFD